MLILSRKEHNAVTVEVVNAEKLKNGDTFKISIEAIQGNRVMLGFHEPDKAFRFVRSELGPKPPEASCRAG